MAVTLESFSLLNPNPNSSSAKKVIAMMALRSSPRSMRFDPLLWRRGSALVASPAARGLSPRRGRSVVVLAASHEESKHSDMEVEKEKDHHNSGTEESQEAWKEALESFKEQALKIQSVSQEAYEIYSKKALIILKETSKDLKIQVDKAGRDLSAITKELSEEGKEYISSAAESSPEVKEIVETFTNSTDDFSDVSKIHDFRVGIPYGLLLSVGGFLSFMATGSTASLRFGVILGGALLALSISSLKAHKRGEKSTLPLKGQAAIASVLFLRDIRLLAQTSSIIGLLTTVLSGTVAAFFIYRTAQDGKRDHGSNHGKTKES